MSDHTYKDFFGDGLTTYHDDGTTSHTYKDFFGDGTTTYHEDGSTSHTYKDFFGDGYTTYHEGGGYGASGAASAAGGYSGYGGYGGYGGGISGGWHVTPIGLGGILLSGVAIGAVGYATLRFMNAFSWFLAGAFVVAFVIGLIQRNTRRDGDRQAVWYRWCGTLATLFALFTMQINPPVIGSAAFLLNVIVFPIVFLCVMNNMLYNALDPLDDSVLYLDVFIVIASAVLLIMRGYGMTDWYFMGHDLFFVVLALRSVLLLRKAYKDCRLSMLAFPVMLVGLYYVATRITGFYGIELALDLASRLLG